MTENIQIGPEDDMRIPQKPVGDILFNALKKQDPTRICFVDDDSKQEINYDQLFSTTVKLANYLTKLGVKRGDVITIVSENNWKCFASILATLFIGATANLLNHDYTTRELKHFFEICNPTVVFCTTKTLKNILNLKDEKCFDGEIVSYSNEISNGIKDFNNILTTVIDKENYYPALVDPEQDVALILTSSGTTGLPKCVMLHYNNIRITFLYAGNPNSLDLNNQIVTLGYLPFFHIFGCLVGLGSILYGAKYIITSKFTPDRFLEIIEKYKINKLFCVPPTLQFLVKSPLVKKYDISSIQDIIFGGAAVMKDVVETVKNQLNIKSVRQIYGMTEVSGAVTCIPKDVVKNDSIGKVVMTFQIKVSDTESGKTLPPNKIGELRIQGPGIMKGYLGNEEESKNAFDHEGFLKSGDLGYYDDDRFFYIVGRLKEIIKYKGFQVSPAELESILLQHPSVKDVGVLGIPDERAGEVPLACVVKQPDCDVTAEELILFVEKNVSIQKRLYGGVKFVNEIPKTPSGKIIRQKLKDL